MTGLNRLTKELEKIMQSLMESLGTYKNTIIWVVCLSVVCLLDILLAVYLSRKKKVSARRKADDDEWEEIDDGDPDDEWEEVVDESDDEWEEASDDYSEDWEEVSAPKKQPISTKTVTTHKTTGSTQHSSYQQIAKQKNSLPRQVNSVRIKIDANHCCICGRQLDNGSTRLNGLQSEQEAWVDSGCLEKLLTIAQGEDYAAFEEAARYMKSRISVVEPDVGDAMQRFLHKAEARIYGDLLK